MRLAALFLTTLSLFASPLTNLFEEMGVTKEEAKTEWLRPNHVLRWQQKDLELGKRARVLKLFDEMGFFAEKAPSRKTYDYCIVASASTVRLPLRYRFYEKLLQSGVSMTHTVLLASKRPLDHTFEKHEECATEEEAVHVIRTEYPNLNAAEICVAENQFSFTEGLRVWLRNNPDPGSVLIISNQPYCKQHRAAAKSVLPSNFTVEVVGEGCDPTKQRVVDLLDTLARLMNNKF